MAQLFCIIYFELLIICCTFALGIYQFSEMDYKILNFVIFCVGSVADTLKMSAKDVYHRMSDGAIISDYIVPCYDVLHTFSREYIVEDLIDLMNKKGVLKVA